MGERAEENEDRAGLPRRRFPRYNDCVSVYLVLEGEHEGHLTQTRDVAIGGMGAVAPEGMHYEENLTLLVEFPLGRSPSRIRTRCMIRGVSMDDEEILNMQFLDDSELFQATVAACIQAWESRLQQDRRKLP